MVTLAIGIGAPSTMFAFAGAILRPLPTHDGEVVVDVGLSDRSTGRTYSLPHSTFALLRDRASGLGSGLTALGAYRSDYVAVSSSEGAPARYRAAYVSAEIFQIMDARAVAGRVFTRADAAAAGPPLAVLGEDIWEDRFDRDPSILGGTLRIDGVTHTVVGVLPADFAFPSRQELWMSFDLRPGRNNAVSMVGRVPEGALPERVEEELLALTGRSPDEPLKDLDDPMIRVREYVGAFYAGDAGIFEKIIWLSIILTIIAAANVASIMLARGASRASETSVRMAIGGSRSRVMSQLVYEAVILAACGVGLGLGLASAALTLIRSQFKVANAPFWVTVELGPSSFWFAGLLAGGAVVVAGLLPAFRASKVELSDALKPQGRGLASLTGGSLFPAIIAIEVTLSCVMLLLSGLIVKDAVTETVSSARFDDAEILTGRLVLEDFDYPDAESRRRCHRALTDLLVGEAGIGRFAFASRLPGKDGARRATRVGGERYDDARSIPIAQIRSVSPTFFPMLGLSSVQGRLLEDADRADTERVAVVNEAFARQRLPDRQVVGARLGFGSDPQDDTMLTIVGVVADGQATPLMDGRPAPGVYLPISQDVPEAFHVMARSSGSASTLPVLRQATARLGSHLPWGEVMTLSEVIWQERSDERLLLGLFGSFGILALLLAAVGLNGVVSLTTSARTRELGIRRALGATGAVVLRGTIWRGLKPVLFGIAVGSAFGIAIVPLFDGELMTADSGDVIVYVAIPILLAAVCVLAVLSPALAAARRHPMQVLREE